MKTEKRFAELDGLRGLAAITVVFEHLSNAGVPVVPVPFLGGQSRVAVWVFFVLSAFLLTSRAIATPGTDRSRVSVAPRPV
ncbi:acyltransferase family protein [Bradyrhizobium barranii subsp. apii]|uniref:acyltransferase family protein n=1 Tax=Bradyrhizobium barranii TaxID=2992140 RepID=UPI001AA0E160|nr:acyltransferase family protein [Bradyrhizobium barranii]UPU00223.1 acyltransferase family protein [Bradyrhizobium barranii subsp. apii]